MGRVTKSKKNKRLALAKAREKGYRRKLAEKLQRQREKVFKKYKVTVRDKQVQIEVKSEDDSISKFDRNLDVKEEVFSDAEDDCYETSGDPPRRHCLLCFKETKLTLESVESSTDMDLLQLFVLKKMLDIPSETLQQYLKEYGHPRNWVSYCHQCIPLIGQAFAVQKEINQLETKLKEFQEKIRNTIVGAVTHCKTLLDVALEIDKLKSDHRLKVTSQVWSRVAYGASKPAEHFNTSSPPSGTADPGIPDNNTEWDDNDDNAFTPVQHFILEDDESTDNLVNGKHTSNEDYLGNEIILTNHKILVDVDKKDCSKEDIFGPTSEATQLSYKTSEIALYDCVLCPNLRTMKINQFVKHLNFHKDHPYQCQECDTYFTENQLAASNFPKLSHKKDGLPEDHVCSRKSLVKVKFEVGKLWSCAYCSEKFHSETDRTFHEQRCHCLKPKIKLPYRCTVCLNGFRTVAEWWLHRALEHLDLAKFGCFCCDKIFKLTTKEGMDILDTRERRSHIKDDHSDHRRGINWCDFLECDVCGANFQYKPDLKSHAKEEHGLDLNQAFACPICFVTRPNAESRRQHLRTFHAKKGRNKLVCDICPYEAVTRSVFQEHRLIKHGIHPENEVPIYKCSEAQCTYQSIIKKNFESHMMKNHNAPRQHKCSVCGKEFMCIKHLRDHQEIHENATNKPYQCELCGNSFAVKNYLYIHMRLSHQNRPFASTHKKRPSERRRRKKMEKPTVSNQETAVEVESSYSSSEVQCAQRTS